MVERDVGHAPLPPQQVHALPVDVVRVDRLLALEHIQPPVLGGLGGVGRLAITHVDAVDLTRRGKAAGEGVCHEKGVWHQKGCVARVAWEGGGIVCDEGCDRRRDQNNRMCLASFRLDVTSKHRLFGVS